MTSRVTLAAAASAYWFWGEPPEFGVLPGPGGEVVGDWSDGGGGIFCGAIGGV